ncbi:MAG: exopolyphosphatase [Planctomycetaceae bacterium]|nr:exopolyphosphatase [Planctomycetaceae bacterium]
MSTDSLKIESVPDGSLEKVRQIAVIEIGTTAIRMAIAEGTSQGELRTLESLRQSVAIGNDTYSTGRISRKTIEMCVDVLRGYQEKLREYRLEDVENIRVVATSAVREAENTLSFIDRIYIATGWEVDVLDVAEVHRVMYQSIQSSREKIDGLGQDRWVIAEVGGGNTEYLLMHHGEIESSNAVRLGSLRLRALLKRYHTSETRWPQLLRNHAQNALAETRLSIGELPVKLLALGGEMRFFIAKTQGVLSTEKAVRLQLSDLEKFTDQILNKNVDEVVREFKISLLDAETLGPALVANMELAHALNVDHLYVLPVSLRDGLLRELIDQDVWSEDLVNQIVRSAVDVGRKFEFDEAHAHHVVRLSKMLFNQLEELHGLGRQYELLLVLSSLLHEIGLYVGTSAYHKHSMYLIQNSELFGLSRRQLTIISLVARYHRRASPKSTHNSFANLRRKDRIAVIKLAAILRIAVAMDSSRSQRIHDFECSVDSQQLLITIPDQADLSMEKMMIQQIGGLFQDTFGMRILLRGAGGAGRNWN